MSIATRYFGLLLSHSYRNGALSSVNSIGIILKPKSLYDIPTLLITKASLSTTFKIDDDVPVIPISNLNEGRINQADKANTLVGPFKRLSPMGRDERIAYLEKTIIQKDDKLNEVVEKINMLSAKRDSLLDNYEQLTNIEERRFKVIEEQDLPDLRKDKDRLAAHIADVMKELNTLRAFPQTLRTEEGISNPIIFYPTLSL
jgi:hypothetical protein